MLAPREIGIPMRRRSLAIFQELSLHGSIGRLEWRKHPLYHSIYPSEISEPIDVPRIAPAEASGSPRPARTSAFAISSPEIALKSTSRTSSIVVGIIFPFPW